MTIVTKQTITAKKTLCGVYLQDFFLFSILSPFYIKACVNYSLTSLIYFCEIAPSNFGISTESAFFKSTEVYAFMY